MFELKRDEDLQRNTTLLPSTVGRAKGNMQEESIHGVYVVGNALYSWTYLRCILSKNPLKRTPEKRRNNILYTPA